MLSSWWMSCLDFKSIPTVGSSKMRIRGLPSKPTNILILRLFPPDNVDTLADVSSKFNCCKYSLIVVSLIGFLQSDLKN